MTDVLQDQINRGHAAERLFNDPLMVEAFEMVANDITNRWAASDPADVAGRERLYHELQVVHAVRDRLRSVVATGRLAAAEVKRRGLLEKARELAKRAGLSA